LKLYANGKARLVVEMHKINLSGMLDFEKDTLAVDVTAKGALRVCHEPRLGIAFIYLLGRDA